MKHKKMLFGILVLSIALIMVPELGLANVESSLLGIQTKLTRVILPTLSIIAIAWAAFSLMSGNERAKTHMWYAILGSIIGFGAGAIVDFISQAVH
ncbi:MAG: hypothetical protein B7Y39_01905 [Bdellovibrio sp. 28-41-41]|nr:MAG: hypothetical protein B7Y39_01905 [Bdellovibrio sp. 28-41-41]